MENSVAITSFTPRPTRSSAPKPFSTKMPTVNTSGKHIDGESSDGSLPEENVYTPSKARKGKDKAREAVSITSDNDEEEAPATANSGRSSRIEVVIFSPKSGIKPTSSKSNHQNSKRAVMISSENSEDEKGDEGGFPESHQSVAPVSKSTRNSGRKKAHKYVELSSSESESEEFELSLPQHSGRKPKEPTLFSTVPKGRSSTPIQAPISSDNDVPLTRKLIMTGTKKSLFSSVPKGKSSSPVQDQTGEVWHASEDEDEDEDDDIVMSTQHSRRKRPVVPTSNYVNDDDDDEIQISSPLKRRRATIESDDSDIASSPLKRKRPNPVYSEDEEDDLPMTNNKSQLPESTPRKTRQSRRRHRTEKEKKLELLKRRRAGEHIEELTESEETGSEDESSSDLQKLSEFEDEEEEEIVVKSKTASKKRQKKHGSGSDQDQYDSDFIEDDEDGELGVPTLSLLDIPLEFTHAAHKPLKEHFKDAVEWMVHAKINPGFARDDPLYVQAFKKLDDEYGGYAKSKFVSTQWTPE